MLAISYTSSLSILSASTVRSSKQNNPRKRNRKRGNQSQFDKSKRNDLNFPSSSPTPLILKQNPQPQTKIQALDAVVSDLEQAILRNGIKVDTQIFCSLLEACYELNAIDHGVRIYRLIPPRLLCKNMEEEGAEPDRHTFPRALKACGGIGSIHVGEEIHRHVVRYGYFDDGYVLNALIDMYAKCGDIVKARKVFDRIASKDLVSWNTMMTSYIHHGLLANAMEIFRHMLKAGFKPDEFSISTILTEVSSLRLGGQIHGWVLRHGLEWDLPIINALIASYSSYGLLDQARWLFSHMLERDIVSWNSIISAHQKDSRALTYFHQMQEDGVMPNAITFVLLLSTCAHLGLVREGESFFSLMREEYRIKPIMEHYACMVNLYGRAGLIAEAYEIIVRKMELEAGPTAWGALLYACSLNANADIGEIAAHKLFELEPDNEHNFELLMRIYDSQGRSDDVERVKQMMLARGLD
ncbi:hypothetical protein Cgig2_010520 [Carnegiea gigantea]|uniref:Pentatricopeptide repeat-containing protein n=1 Tax=Carnegiea gigantea TaxID=171969 RepID=A0A9Q1QMX5_9CARY|nr:hypothetical protein Cgig2_010520 [Carnegiea gigantea]